MATKQRISITEAVGSYLCSYESQRKQLAVVGNDSRIKIWDTQRGKLSQLKEGQHLNKKYTCISWCNITKEKDTQVLLAAGTDKGEIIVWDVLKSNIVHQWSQKVTGQGHIGQVNDIAFGKNGTIYSCSEDKTILSWSLLSGALVSTVHTSKEAVNKICVSHDGSVLAAAGTKIELIDLSSSKVFKKLTGHTNIITSMKFSHDSSLLVTSAKDRFIYLWSTNSNSTSTSALKAFTCESNPLFLDFAPAVKSTTYRFLGVTERGIVNVFNYNTSEESDEHSIIRSPGTDSNMIFFSQFGSYDHVFVTYGANLVTPSFLTLEIADSQGNLLPEVQTTLPKQQQDRKTAKTVTITPDKAENPVIDSRNAPLPKASMRKQNNNDMDIEGEANVVTPIPDSIGKSKGKADQKGVDEQSVTIKTALYQGLRSSDIKLLTEVLCVSRVPRAIVFQSVKGLPSLYAVKLLQICSEMIQHQENRAHVLHLWIKAVIQHHTSYLISYPDLVRTLSTLYLSIDKRVAVFPKLIKLHGRLDLLVSQYEKEVAATKKDIPTYTEDSDDEDDESQQNTSMKANLITQSNQSLNLSDDEEDQEDEDEEEEEEEGMDENSDDNNAMSEDDE
mmetsp:Transcript_14033/g.19518  ORF Transcript_14033/g.19518 Transcript_14033/m.19518 type:complete len:615 (+) Transcript_14033:82-1926(+)